MKAVLLTQWIDASSGTSSITTYLIFERASWTTRYECSDVRACALTHARTRAHIPTYARTHTYVRAHTYLRTRTRGNTLTRTLFRTYRLHRFSSLLHWSLTFSLSLALLPFSFHLIFPSLLSFPTPAPGFSSCDSSSRFIRFSFNYFAC